MTSEADLNSNLKEYNNIIWDWNGTLLDDTWLCVDILNHMLERRQLGVISIEYYRRIFDFPVIDFYRKIRFDFNVEPFDEVACEFMDEYNARRNSCSLHEGAQEALKSLSEMGLQQHVLSVYEQNDLKTVINEFGLSRYFATIIGQKDHYATGKMALGKQLLKDENIAPDTALMIGDTTHDYEVSQAIGVDILLVSRGHHCRQQLQMCNVPVLNSLREAVEMIVSDSHNDTSSHSL